MKLTGVRYGGQWGERGKGDRKKILRIKYFLMHAWTEKRKEKKAK